MPVSDFLDYENNELILRDRLAIERTLLANERTLLSYLRFGVTLIIAGVSMMHFSMEPWFHYIGLACVPIGIIASIIGIKRFTERHDSIVKIQKHAPVSEVEAAQKVSA
jgi:putative membrane protein